MLRRVCILAAALGVILAGSVLAGDQGPAAVTYVNTAGEKIARPTVCLPEHQLNASTIRVYQKTPEDLSLFAKELEKSGAAADDVKGALMLAQTQYTCDRKAASECSDGTCASGQTCKLVTSGSFNYCRCRPS